MYPLSMFVTATVQFIELHDKQYQLKIKVRIQPRSASKVTIRTFEPSTFPLYIFVQPKIPFRLTSNQFVQSI